MLSCEVRQPGGYLSSSGSSSMHAPNHQVECDADFPWLVTMDSQSPLTDSIKEGGLCFGHVKRLIICDMFCP